MMGVNKPPKDGSEGISREWMRLLFDYYPLGPIHKEADYKKAIGAVDRLVGRELSGVQREYLESLSILISDYEGAHFGIDEGMSPLEVVRFLVEENGMTASELGMILGDRSLGSRILRGERGLSKAHIRRLADRFCVSAALFI